ncbi:hypothetical protein AOCH_001944 [Aspergillus ochraceoroseus]|uniref:Uncharacterized protein n=1 Tax=Aspergillus ochraceoroseus TaxID=138278 RepID=A0A0F8X410_9EURO|nr:hypothetical protein AOCH_001944 [Aspergillus ochraceoroseus]
MSSSLPGNRDLPSSQYDLTTYWGRVRHAADISDPRMLFTSSTGLEQAKRLISSYKQNELPAMTPELWQAKKVVDSTLHPDTGEPVFLPFRMSCYVLSNLIVTAGMLTPGLKTTGTLLWQITNQSLNVAINNANANNVSILLCSLGFECPGPPSEGISPSTKLILGRLVPFAAVSSASALNVFLMRGEEIRQGIDVYPVLTEEEKKKREETGEPVQSLGKSKKAATIAVGETAISRVLNATPIMVVPPLVLVQLEKTKWLQARPRMVLPINLALILGTSLFALPLALGAFPQRQAISATSLEEEFWDRGGKNGQVEFNRGMALGSIVPSAFQRAQSTRLIHQLEPAPGIRFSSVKTDEDDILAHSAGVNVLAIDQYERRFMVSGGADPSLHLWDLETRGSELDYIHQPVASSTKFSHEAAHTHAITSISIYPFDPTPSTIITTSHDGTLKLSALRSDCILPVHTFKLHCTPYTHSLSCHPSSPLLIAVGSSEKPVRLLDLRSGLSTHGLPGHHSAVLSVSWAPHRPHILASASTDNRVILFDIRRAGHNSAIATLDMDDAVGLIPPANASASYQTRLAFSPHARAHNGAVTGVRWTSDGAHLVTAGQDARIRVWNATTGANTLVHFGPRIQNSASSHLAERVPLIVPCDQVEAGHETLLWANFNESDDRGEIFMFELREGTFLKRLKVPGLINRRQQPQGRSNALSAARINALAWRGNGASGEGLEVFSGHGDGTLRSWVAREPEEGPTEAEEMEQADHKRKRDVLEEIYHGFL